MPASKGEIEYAARQQWGCESANVVSMVERSVWSRERVSWYVLAIRHAGQPEARIIGRRETLDELLELAQRGPL